MRLPIDFHDKFKTRAEEVEDVRSGGILMPEPEARAVLAQRLPEQHLGQKHLPALMLCYPLGALRPVQHAASYPSTSLRLVPLPLRGRNEKSSPCIKLQWQLPQPRRSLHPVPLAGEGGERSEAGRGFSGIHLAAPSHQILTPAKWLKAANTRLADWRRPRRSSDATKHAQRGRHHATRIYSAVAAVIVTANGLLSMRRFFDRAFANASVIVPLLSVITSAIAAFCIGRIDKARPVASHRKGANHSGGTWQLPPQ
jgi:hypothetical protein